MTIGHDDMPFGDETWLDMTGAPRDGTTVRLLHARLGAVEGHYCGSGWTEDTHVSPAEFMGAVWLVDDDEIEVVENGPDAPLPYDDGPLKGWMPMAATRRDTLSRPSIRG